MKKALVIGSGIAGIATAIRLSCKGFEVHVFEKNEYLGGKLTAFENKGFRFDAGPSLFTMPNYVDELFRLAGRDPKDYFTYMKHPTAAHYFWNDGTSFFAPSDPLKFAAFASQIFGVKQQVVRKKFDKAKYIHGKIGHLFLEQSLHRIKGFVNLETVQAAVSLPKLDIHTSLHAANQRDLKKNKLVQIFDRFATYNGSNPYQTPGIMGIIPHYEHNVGTFFPHKGMHSITESLVELCKELGVQFHLGAEVKEIRTQNGKVLGIVVGDQQIDAQVVVSNMDVRFVYEKLLPNQRLLRKISKREPSSSAVIFYWGIKRKFPNLDLHNLFFANDYKAEFDTIFKDPKVVDDPTVYVHISSKVCTEDAPEGCENWFVMVNAPSKGTIDWDGYVSKTREVILKKLSRILEVKMEELIVCETIMDPRSIESKTYSFDGALYGTSSNSRMAAFLRHPNFDRKNKGLYFVGGSVHPGGGIPLCLLSAKIVSEHVG